MKITILNGNATEDNPDFERYVANLAGILDSRGHTVDVLPLRQMDIKTCLGCWGCWVRTPGECVFSDDSADVRRRVINAEALLFASPVIMGFTSGILKKTCDKLIPLVLPYIEIDQGECHHIKRYDSYPVLGLLLHPAEDSDDEDIEIISECYRRLSINFKSRLAFVQQTSVDPQEVARAFDAI